MNNKREITIEIDRLDTLGDVVKAYQDIASSRIQRVRSSVLKNRDFTKELNEIFAQVKKSYEEEIEELTKQTHNRTLTDFSVMPKNGKRICVYISANAGLYGTIVRRTFELFVRETKTPNTDFVIIGKIGKQYFEQETNHPFMYFEFPDDQFSPEAAKKLIDVLIEYDTVVLYHGIFNNVVSQTATATNISGGEEKIVKEIETTSLARKKEHWIIEPSLSEVLRFFETEIFSSLLAQIMHESQLAKLGSRLLSLTDSSETIRDEKAKTSLEKIRLQHYASNKKQLNSLNGIMLWKLR